MKRAIIIVDHGSRLHEANAMLDAFAGMLRGMTGDAVYPAHMELAAPTITEAFDAAVADGAEFVFVFPYFLSPGRHSREDIPRMCTDAAARHPNVRWHCSGPIGLDRGVAELVLHRINQCEANAYTCETCPDRTKCQ